ncbi:hypothetical protein BDV93DRAFT_526995 [Ceratobasidium sp. AG-I]|nr:hypothetical protein BDV93DRAFT_526995 [Ceratobasidium sp. AG-I]
MRELLASHNPVQQLDSKDKRKSHTHRSNPSGCRFATELVSGFAGAFASPYFGAAADGLFEHLERCNKNFVQNHPGPYQGRYCSIVQSSGTGKTRTIIELAKRDVLVVYMNARPLDHTKSYPRRDAIPADILTMGLGCSADELTDRYVAFFHALFDALRSWLSRISTKSKPPVEVIQTWSEWMCNLESTYRKLFFKDLKAKYQTILSNIKLQRGTFTNQSDQSALFGGKQMTEAYMQLVDELPELFRDPAKPHSPKMVIAIDAPHELSEPTGSGYRLSRVLCKVIGAFSSARDVSNWVLFASTDFEVADFSASSDVYSSHRMLRDRVFLFPPYVRLGWDQVAPNLEDLKSTPQHVARFDRIVRYGRPLWASLLTSTSSSDIILQTACEKLCKSLTFDPYNYMQALAVLGQRFCLNPRFGNHRALAYLQNSVSSYMLVCADTTEDMTWQTTLYPSEPLLSCAASKLLHRRPNNIHGALLCFGDEVTRGLIDIAKRGELASRLILLLAKDLCVRQPNVLPPNWGEKTLLDCRPLPVTEYLKFMFGADRLSDSMKELFHDWYIDFSHWILMDEKVQVGSEGHLSAEDWITRHWHRTAAVQCSKDQPGIDKVIPMYRLSPLLEPDSISQAKPEGWSNSEASYILILDRSGRDAAPELVNSISPKLLGSETGPPFIAMHLDLRTSGEKPTFALTQDVEEEGTCLRIYAPGINTSTYPFLENIRDSVSQLEFLANPSTGKHGRSSNSAFLRGRVDFGGSSREQHMRWEAGAERPHSTEK